jgi:DNA recombination protein RmuC
MTVALIGAVVLLVILGVIAAAVVALLRRPSAADLAAGWELRFAALERGLEKTERGLRDELARSREESSAQARSQREELQNAVQSLSQNLRESLVAIGAAQKDQLETSSRELGEGLARLTRVTEERLEKIRAVVDERLQSLQRENAEKLEQMRRTVDEQLQGTLEKRLGESFKLVSERLEQVYKGLGEMQTLATGVGDLKKALTNVRVRGSWGEIQLGALLEDTLHPDQYERNVATTGTSERVEFAIRMPGPDAGSTVYLPLDAKFPIEDYQRLVDASERGDTAEMELCGRALELRVRGCARDIRDKYIAPPATTDFGIMYLPTESLYAEVLRRPGLVESLQRDYRIAITGPTTLAAFLNSLQMGFRTLAIQKRSSEVWELLGVVKTEFGRYADILEKVQKKLQQASNTVDDGLRRTRVIAKKLRGVEEAPSMDPELLIAEEEEEPSAALQES